MKMVKAKLEEAEGAKRLEFKFNPSEYSVKKGAHWEAPKRNMKSKAGSRPDYIGSDPQTVSLQIFFDDWEAVMGSISKDVDQLFDWCTPSKSSMGTKPQPPLLRFVWGSNLQLAMQRFYLESVSVKYTMFGRSGNPLRATADITLKEVPSELGPQNPTSGSIHARRTHLISEGDTLQSIATSEYGNPNLWRGLAMFNDIDDPMRLTMGSRILLPSPEEASEGSR